MKRTHLKARRLPEKTRSGETSAATEPIRSAIAQVKQSLLYEYAELTGKNTRLLRLALNEAEAVAWQSGFPHLVFPVLATEKAWAAVAWHRRQHALRRNESERAFAE